MKDVGTCGSLISFPTLPLHIQLLELVWLLFWTDLDQVGFLLQKFLTQCQLPVFMTALCHPLNLQICTKRVSEGVGSADFSVAATFAVPLEAGECLVLSRGSSGVSSDHRGISGSCFTVGLCGDTHEWKWGAGRTRHILVFFWVRFQFKDPSL